MLGLQQNHMPRLGLDPPLASLTEAWVSARAATVERTAWLRPGRSQPGVILPSEAELRAVLTVASNAGDQGALTYLVEGDGSEFVEHRMLGPALPWTASSDAAPTAQRCLIAGCEGGLVLLRATRFSTVLADLCDDVALAMGAHTSVVIISGGMPAGSTALGSANHFTVFPVAGSFDVAMDDATAPVTVAPGSALTVTSLVHLSSDADGLAVVIAVTKPTNDDVLLFSARKGGHWPRLRGDVPFDLHAPASAYGEDHPVDPTDHLLAEIGALHADGTAAEAFVWTRGVLRPAPRPNPPRSAYPRDLKSWTRCSVRGRFPGGLSNLGADGGGWWLVAAGCAVHTSDHLIDIFPRLLDGRPVTVSSLVTDCPAGDPMSAARAVERLFSLGLVSIES